MGTKIEEKRIKYYISNIQECLLEINLFGKIQEDTYIELSANVKKIRKELGIPLSRYRILSQKNKKEERASSQP